MENINIDTTQNVSISYNAASVGERILAYFVDAIFLIIYAIAVIFFIDFIKDKIDIPWIGISLLIILAIPFLFYDLLCEQFMEGQSFGKKIVKLKVVKLDGSAPGFSSYFLRWILRPVDISLFNGVISIVTILINGKGQRLGDIAAHTCVITLKEDVSIRDTIYYETDDDYQPLFPQAEQLDEEDIVIIKELIDSGSGIDIPENVVENEWKAKKIICQRLEIESDLRPLDFFRVLIRDYNHIHGRLD